MLAIQRARLFKNGSSQAVRLPPKFRFKTTEVYISRDDITGDVTLSLHPGAKAWAVFFDLLKHIDVPKGFMSERPMNTPPAARDLFNDALHYRGDFNVCLNDSACCSALTPTDCSSS